MSKTYDLKELSERYEFLKTQKHLDIYGRYERQFLKTQIHLIKKGFDKSVYDIPMLSKAELEFKLGNFKQSRTSKSGFTNFIRQAVTSRFYERTIEQAKNLQDLLQSFGIEKINGKNISIENLRIFGLAELNEALKKAGYTDSYDRRDYISWFVYDSK